ncbi:hypothetical protein JCM10213v2_002192 [Rhodosporidiobolus nylandii]
MSTLAEFALNLHVASESLPPPRYVNTAPPPRTDQAARPKDTPRRILLDPSLASFELERFAVFLHEHTPRQPTPDILSAALEESRRRVGRTAGEHPSHGFMYLEDVVGDTYRLLDTLFAPARQGARMANSDLEKGIPDPDADGERLALHGRYDRALVLVDGKQRRTVKHVVEFISPHASNGTEDAFFSRLTRRMENGMLRLDEALLREDQQLHDLLLKLSTACVALPCPSFSLFDSRSFVLGRLVFDAAQPATFDILLSPVLPFPTSAADATPSPSAIAYASVLLSTCYDHTDRSIYRQRAAALLGGLRQENKLRVQESSEEPEDHTAELARDDDREREEEQQARLDELSQAPAISLRFPNGLSPSPNVFLRVTPPPLLSHMDDPHPALWAPTSELTTPLALSAPPPPLLSLTSTAGMGLTAIVYRSFALPTSPSPPSLSSPLDSQSPSSNLDASSNGVCAKVAWPGMRSELRHQASLYERAAAAGVSDVFVRFFGLFETGEDERGTALLTEDGGHRLGQFSELEREDRIRLFLLVLRLHLVAHITHGDIRPPNVVKLSPSSSFSGAVQPRLRLIDPNGDDHPDCEGAECWELGDLARNLELHSEEGWTELRSRASEVGLRLD